MEIIVSGLSNITWYMFQSVAGESPRTVVDAMADVFVAMKKNQLELLVRLLNEMVQQEGFPSSHCTKQEKEQFTSQLLRSVAVMCAT